MGGADYGSSRQGNPTAQVETRSAGWQQEMPQLSISVARPPGESECGPLGAVEGFGAVKVNV